MSAYACTLTHRRVTPELGGHVLRLVTVLPQGFWEGWEGAVQLY
jgi:hypothetical protein